MELRHVFILRSRFSVKERIKDTISDLYGRDIN
jgi:hypothetical protein